MSKLSKKLSETVCMRDACYFCIGHYYMQDICARVYTFILTEIVQTNAEK